MTLTELIRAIKPFVLSWITTSSPVPSVLPDHDHSGDAGDGAAFDAANLTSGTATATHVLTADGSGGAAWAAGGGSPDAADVTYTPTTAADWDGSADPGDVDNALDQLAERVADVEGAGYLTSVDAAVVTYTPTTAADWDSSADPGNADDAFDQLAERVKDIEDAGGAGSPDASAVTYTPTTTTDWDSDTDPGNVDGALDQLAGRVTDVEGSGTAIGAYIYRAATGATGNLTTAAAADLAADTMDTLLRNDGCTVSLTNGTIQVPVAGWYHLFGHLRQASAQNVNFLIYITDSSNNVLLRSSQIQTTQSDIHGSGVRYIAANTTLKMRYFLASGSTGVVGDAQGVMTCLAVVKVG